MTTTIKNNIHYKIVSPKESLQVCSSMREGLSYNLELSSMIHNLGNIKIHPGPVGYVMVDNNTKIPLEDSIHDLYVARNIKGLCFVK